MRLVFLEPVFHVKRTMTSEDRESKSTELEGHKGSPDVGGRKKAQEDRNISYAVSCFRLIKEQTLSIRFFPWCGQSRGPT